MALLLLIQSDALTNKNNTPVDFTSPAEIVFFILVPVALLLMYVFFRRKARGTDDVSSKSSEKEVQP